MTSVSHDNLSTAVADELATRQTPWSSEAEQAVLGAMMLDADAALRALELLDEAAFWREPHRKLFSALKALVERVDVTDPVALTDELEKRGELEEDRSAEQEPYRFVPRHWIDNDRSGHTLHCFLFHNLCGELTRCDGIFTDFPD